MLFELDTLPRAVRDTVASHPVTDCSSSPEARVYRVGAGGEFFLKLSDVGALKCEAEMDAYLHSLSLGPEVLFYGECSGQDMLLTRRVSGKPLTDSMYLRDGRRLAISLAESMRAFHSLPTELSPVADRITPYLKGAYESYESGARPHSSLSSYSRLKSHEDAYRILKASEGMLRRDVLIHGDFCLPNVIYDGWRLSGYIDLGCGGVGDRHIDIFWGLWTLNFNLGTNRYSDIFLDAYGRDTVDKERLLAVSCAEALI
ncbi:MAG: aminoglycoside 3'-phosphotransferase [Clostridia bacterium]|nr:aminoglycoside 3'-phosphotransferase [Clostridia bacterium]